MNDTSTRPTTIDTCLNRIVKCKDGSLRKLFKIEVKLLHYSVPIGKGVWMELSGTYRNQIENEFLEGSFVTAIETETIPRK